MRAAKSRKIEGVTYEVMPLNTSDGIAVLTKLGKLAGPAFGKVSSLREAAATILAALGTLAERLNDADVLDVLKKLAEHTRVLGEGPKGKAVQLSATFDEHFAGEYAALFAWAAFALEVNYGPLLRAFGAKVAAAAPDASDAAAG